MIYLECYADEALVRSFGATSRMVKHAFSKGEVCNMLRKASNAVGIIDEDPHSGKPSYEKSMLGNKVYEDARVILCQEKGSGNKLVIIRPALEEFIIKLSRDYKIDIGSYKLASDPERLHDELSFKKNQQKFKDFDRLLSDLLKKDKTMADLKRFII